MILFTALEKVMPCVLKTSPVAWLQCFRHAISIYWAPSNWQTLLSAGFVEKNKMRSCLQGALKQDGVWHWAKEPLSSLYPALCNTSSSQIFSSMRPSLKMEWNIMFSQCTRANWRFVWGTQLSICTYFTREFIFHPEGLCKWGSGKTCWDYCHTVSSHTRDARTQNFRWWKQPIYLQKWLPGTAQDISWTHFAQRHNGQKNDNILIKSLCDIM